MKLPKDTEDWHQKLISAFDDRARYAVARGKKDQHNWRNALEALRKSQDPIYVQKGGENKGVVKGIPKAIGMGAVRDRLIAIVKGNEAWDDPKYQDLAEINLTATTFFRNRKYKDSCYGILASMFSQTKGDPTILNKAQIVHSLRKYHDGAPDYDYHTGQQGAWKAIDQLVAKNLVSREKVNLMWRYQLTNEGFRYCYLIFNEKFHPSRGAYQLVEPGNCIVSPEGVVTRRNGQPAALANAAAGGNPRGADVFGGLHAGGFGGLNDQEDGDVGGGEFGEDDWGATHHPTLSVVKKPRLDYDHNFNFDHTRTEQKPYNLHNVSQTSATVPELTQRELRDKRIQRLDPEFERRYAVVQKAMVDMDLSYEEAEVIVRAEEAIAAEKRRAEHRAQQEALLQEKRALEEAKRLSTLSSAAPNRSGTGNSESQDLEEALFQSELSALEEEERRRELDISLVGEKRSLDEDYETFEDFDYDPVCFDWEDGDDSDCEDRAVTKNFSQDSSATPRKRHSSSSHSTSSSRAAVDGAAAEAKFPAEQQPGDSQEEACLEVALAMSLENDSHLLPSDTVSTSTAIAANPSHDKMLVSPLRLTRPTHSTQSIQSSRNYCSFVNPGEVQDSDEEVPVSKRSAAWTPTALKSPKANTTTAGVATATTPGTKSARNYVMDLTEEKPARPAAKTTNNNSSSNGNNSGGGATLHSPYRRGGLSLNERLNQSIASLPSSPLPVVRPAQQPLFASPHPTTDINSSAHNNVTASSASTNNRIPLFTASYSAASNVVDLCLSDDDDEAETQPLPELSDSEGDYHVRDVDA